MDQEELKQNIAKYYSQLPEKTQKFFSRMDWMKIIEDLGIKYRLDKNQVEILGTETTLVLLAITKIEEYREILEINLEIPKDIFTELFNEINLRILNDHYKEIEETYDKNVLTLLDEKYSVGGKKLDERFNSLPKEVQEAINESNYQVTLYTIADEYKLTVEQMSILEELTTKVMLGIIHPDKYEEEMIVKIIIPKEDISNLVKDVNEEILKTIRESLKKHWNSDSDDEIPLPPYAKIINNEEPASPSSPRIETSQGGLRIKNDGKAEDEIPLPPHKVINNEELIIKSEKEMEPIVGISDTPLNIIEEKLKGVTKSDQTVSNHSLPKIKTMSDIKKNDLNPEAKTHDPYREPF